MPAAANCPVFVEYAPRQASWSGLKHSDDKVAPGRLSEPPCLRPLRYGGSNGGDAWIAHAGWRAGLERRLGVRFLRRSHAIKEVLQGTMSSHDMFRDTQHGAGQEHLHRESYTAEIPLAMHLKRRGASRQHSLVNGDRVDLHTTPHRLVVKTIDDTVLAELRRKLAAVVRAMTRGNGGGAEDDDTEVLAALKHQSDLPTRRVAHAISLARRFDTDGQGLDFLIALVANQQSALTAASVWFPATSRARAFDVHEYAASSSRRPLRP